MTSGGFQPRVPHDRPDPDRAIWQLLTGACVTAVGLLAVCLTWP